MTLSPSTDAPENDGRETINVGVHYSWGVGHAGFEVWDNKRPDDPVATFDDASRYSAWQRFKSLESAAQERHRRRASRIARWGRRFALVGVPVLAAGLLAAMLVRGNDRSGLHDGSRGDAVTGTWFRNTAGDYRFRLPAGWTAQERSTATEVRSPDGAVDASIDVVSGGDIADVAPRVFGSLTSGWTDVQVESPVQRSGSVPGHRVNGIATDASGRPIRFLGIVIDTGARNLAMSVSVPQDWDPVATLPEIDQIIDSLKA